MWGFYKIPSTFLMAPQNVTHIEQFCVVHLQSGFTQEALKILKKPHTVFVSPLNQFVLMFAQTQRLQVIQ